MDPVTRTTRLAAAAAALASVVCLAQPAPEAVRRPSEYEVKAAFLLNFTRFVEWPRAGGGAGRPFAICITGSDPFGTMLDHLVEGERADGREIVVRRMSQPSHDCQLLFVPGSSEAEDEILSRVGPGVLTVGETATFNRHGGVIAFRLENRRVRFDVNLRAAAESQLQISSRLLSLARRVEK